MRLKAAQIISDHVTHFISNTPEMVQLIDETKNIELMRQLAIVSKEIGTFLNIINKSIDWGDE
jgi:hypothetical protein